MTWLFSGTYEELNKLAKKKTTKIFMGRRH